MNDVESQRTNLLRDKFPRGVPRIWCPALTHFQSAGQPDPVRIRSHLRWMSPYVRGILVPGSTGEGWEMKDSDISRLLEVVLDCAHEFGIHVLIGVLKTNVREIIACLEAMNVLLNHAAVVGITVCPPRGNHLGQPSIRDDLAAVLEQGWPTALYQLPQVTLNEMSAQTVASLAGQFSNFFLFKDTSGADRVALSGLDFGSVFMVRGAEQGGYATWTRTVKGPYDGYLLSTANVFAKELNEIQRLNDVGQHEAAEALSKKLEQLVSQIFSMVADFPVGNAFANANKVLDHCLAYGPMATSIKPPILYSGTRLSESFIEGALGLLESHALLPKVGYLS